VRGEGAEPDADERGQCAEAEEEAVPSTGRPQAREALGSAAARGRAVVDDAAAAHDERGLRHLSAELGGLLDENNRQCISLISRLRDARSDSHDDRREPSSGSS